MKNIKKYSLDDRAIQFIEKILKDGSPVAKELANSGVLYKGMASSYLPKDIDKNLLYSFDQGGLLRSHTHIPPNSRKPIFIENVENTDAERDKILSAFLKTNPNATILVENLMYNRNDPDFDKKQSKICFLDDYKFVISFVQANDSFDQIKKTMREALLRPTTTIFLCHFPATIRLKDFTVIDKSAIKQIAKAIKRIVICEAYDGESFVIWEKSN